MDTRNVGCTAVGVRRFMLSRGRFIYAHEVECGSPTRMIRAKCICNTGVAYGEGGASIRERVHHMTDVGVSRRSLMYCRFEATGHATNGGDTGKLGRRRCELVVERTDKASE